MMAEGGIYMNDVSFRDADAAFDDAIKKDLKIQKIGCICTQMSKMIISKISTQENTEHIHENRGKTNG